MNTARVAAIALIVLGALGLAYGGFTYTKDRQEVSVGSLSVTMSERRTVPVPLWVGAAAILLGAGLLFAPAGKS